MKRLIVFVLLGVLVLSGCGRSDDATSGATKDKNEVSEVTE